MTFKCLHNLYSYKFLIYLTANERVSRLIMVHSRVKIQVVWCDIYIHIYTHLSQQGKHFYIGLGQRPNLYLIND